LVFVVGLNMTTGQTDHALKVFGPTSIACVLMVMVYSFAPISGAHLNPAVTFSLFLQKEIRWTDGLMYIAAQCGGGACAGLATGFLYGWSQSSNGNMVGPKDPSFSIGAPLVEFLYTFLLCFVVLNTAVAQQNKTYYGLAIGFVIIAGGYGGGAVSGGCFNPAVALGVEFMGPNWKFLYLPLYAAAQLAGGFCATTILHIVRKDTIKESESDYWIVTKAYAFEKMFDPEDTAEFLGTFFLCLSISLNGIASNKEGVDNAGGTWSVAATLMCLIYAMGDISGGLFNPALTLAFVGRWYKTGKGFGKEKLCDPEASPKECLKYLACQGLGGAAGTGMTLLIHLGASATEGYMPVDEIGPKNQHTLGQAFFAELFGTFLLCYVVLCVASVQDTLKEYTGFCIGGVIVAAGYAFGPLSGGVLNPAVALANAIVNKVQLLWTAPPLAYLLAEFAGGAIAAVVFRFLTHPHEFDGQTGDLKAELLA